MEIAIKGLSTIISRNEATITAEEVNITFGFAVIAVSITAAVALRYVFYTNTSIKSEEKNYKMKQPEN